MRKLNVTTTLKNNGFSIQVAGKKYDQTYPLNVWQVFPKELQILLARTAAVFFTNHLAVTKKGRLSYNFPPPTPYSLFFHGLIYSLLEVYLYVDDPLKATKKAIDKNLDISFSGIPAAPVSSRLPENKLTDKASILFTFGKDSLLTLGLTKELGFQTQLFFINEPYSPYEYAGRINLKKEFEKKFRQKVNYIDLNLGNLRQNGGEMWGWDMIVLQYMLILTPYIFRNRARYLLVANEYNNNEININANKMRIFYRFEQSSLWTLNSTHLFRFFGLSTSCISLIEPLYEYMTTYILHHRYPDLARFHLSCCADDPTGPFSKWCYICPACARTFIFLKSFSFKPEKIGLKKDMLKANKKKYFDIFDKKNEKITDWKHFIDTHTELLFAFYLATLRGVRGDLIDLFKKRFWKNIEKDLPYLLDRVTNLYPAASLPEKLKPKIKQIFSREISGFKKEVRQLLTIHAGTR